MNKEQQLKNGLDILINSFEEDLTFLHNRDMKKFDMSLMPKVIQDMVKLATSKSPSFSNISSVAVANFVLSNLFGQLRVVINDPIYSDDTLCPNTYSMLIARSGGGKDSTFRALMKACNKATEYIDKLKQEEAELKAKQKYIAEMLKINKDFDQSTVVQADYTDMVPEIEKSLITLGSTRGGITTSLNRLARSEYGAKSIFSSELAMTLQSSPFVMEVLELLATMYDMGSVQSAEYKTADSKEESVEKQFMNFLGISSSAPFYVEGPVRKLLVPLMKSALARRCIVIFSTAAEEYENEKIILLPSEVRTAKALARQEVHRLTESLNEQLLKAVKEAHDDKSVMLDEEASVIYDDYKSYTEALSKRTLLADGESVEGIELSGKAFKMLRIAAIWALASNKRVIDRDTLIGAIYFADHGSVHLQRFIATLELKDYELFINDWQQGFFDNVLPIDKAITKGYINVKQITNQSLTNFLKPVNSKLEGIATVSYNDKANAFIFVPAVKNLDTAYTYRACQGHVTTRPISNIAVDKPMSALNQLLSIQCSFNPFAQETAKFVTFTVNESFLSMQMINKYLINTHHYIATSTDPSNMHAFTIILPINTVISKAEYKYVTMSIANQLMLKVLPEHCEHDHITYGYADAISLSATDNATLFDISGILNNLASGVDVPILPIKAAVKPTATAIEKYFHQEILQHKSTIIDMLNISNNPLLLFATIIYDASVNYVPKLKIIDLIENINASLDRSIPSTIIEEYLIHPILAEV